MILQFRPRVWIVPTLLGLLALGCSENGEIASQTPSDPPTVDGGQKYPAGPSDHPKSPVASSEAPRETLGEEVETAASEGAEASDQPGPSSVVEEFHSLIPR